MPLRPVQMGNRLEDAVSHLFNAGKLRPLFATSAMKFERNSEGYLIHSGRTTSGPIGSYLQVFRNGALESVNTLAERDWVIHKQQIPFLEVELRLFQCLPEYFGALRYLGVPPPVLLGLSLTGVERYTMEVPVPLAFTHQRKSHSIRNETLFLPDAVAESFECDLGLLFKPTLDAAWQASGHAGSMFYQGSEW